VLIAREYARDFVAPHTVGFAEMASGVRNYAPAQYAGRASGSRGLRVVGAVEEKIVAVVPLAVDCETHP
jgi:hypothetical protein